MIPESRGLLRQAVMVSEGLRLKPYRDTVGKLTIGYGRNLDDVGISKLEAEVLLDHDLASVEQECRAAFPWFSGLNEVRQRVIVEMAFNLGIAGVGKFVRMAAALADQQYDEAAAQMLTSRWSAQVGARAVRLADQMRTGRG